MFVIFICLLMRYNVPARYSPLIPSCVNSRRMKRGGGPVRYTGWTVPSYNQSQQQYGYSSGQQGAYDMNNYPQQGQYPQQQGGYSYQGPPNASPQGPGAAGNNPAYFDATQTEAGRSMDRCLGGADC